MGLSPTQRLRALTTPDRARWKPMFLGLGLAAASAGLAVYFKTLAPVSLVMSIVSFVAWCAGACAMIGYVRWFFASEVARLRDQIGDGRK